MGCLNSLKTSGHVGLLVLAAHYFILAHALLIPLQLPANASLSNFTAPVNGGGHSRQPIIPGFRVAVLLAEPFPVKPEDVYICALDYLYGLASKGWEETIPSEKTAMSEEVNGVKIAYRSLATPEARYQLQYKHVVVGILGTVNAMAKKNLFCFAKTDLSLYRDKFGQLVIGRRKPDFLDGTNVFNVTSSEMTPMRTDTKSRAVNANGRIVDPEDSNFLISYKMLRDSIPCQALFSAALDGMASSAVAGDHTRCRSLAGASSSGEVTFLIVGNDPRTSSLVLAYIQVRTVLKLLPTRLYETGSCGAVKFNLTYGGEKIGGGSFFRS